MRALLSEVCLPRACAFRITTSKSMYAALSRTHLYKHFTVEGFLISINLQDKNDTLIIESSIS